jgi:hypothetical protein
MYNIHKPFPPIIRTYAIHNNNGYYIIKKIINIISLPEDKYLKFYIEKTKQHFTSYEADTIDSCIMFQPPVIIIHTYCYNGKDTNYSIFHIDGTGKNTLITEYIRNKYTPTELTTSDYINKHIINLKQKA